MCMPPAWSGGPPDMAINRPFTREQRVTIVYGMLAFVLIIVVLQLWLLTATMNAYLGGDRTVVSPAALVSTLCLLLNVGLLRYLTRLERTPRASRTDGRPDDERTGQDRITRAGEKSG
jgi:hypothetical protein